MKKYLKPTSIDLNVYGELENNLHAKFGLPSEVVFCKKCVISNGDNRIIFKHNKFC